MELFAVQFRRPRLRRLHLSSPEDIAASSRIDAWLTPPAYTGAAPIYLTAQRGANPLLQTPTPLWSRRNSRC
ncbi:DUF4175 family protein [Rhizobium sp. G21]|uniref:DUF4175 family protein n=1 Tax=Rhizobium sp. G21 TaxID=2758439 RepID=UPI002484C786|nr:DUF4175 family protein [Rhizobium sp. G21]